MDGRDLLQSFNRGAYMSRADRLRRAREAYDRANELRNDGWTYAAIAQHLGYSANRVRQFVIDAERASERTKERATWPEKHRNLSDRTVNWLKGAGFDVSQAGSFEKLRFVEDRELVSPGFMRKCLAEIRELYPFEGRSALKGNG